MFGPLPYLSFNDSPFIGNALSTFYLEDFEDGLFNVPGVAATSNASLVVTQPAIGGSDSVDADDGVIDGLGAAGRSFAGLSMGPVQDPAVTFTFDSDMLGGLPSHVGIVWTDGDPLAPTQFEAFDINNESIGIIGPCLISDDSWEGTTGEDNFFGIIHEAGVAKFVISSPGGTRNFEVDHLQYGFTPVPLPGSLWLFSVGIAALVGVKIKSKKISQLKGHCV